MIRKAMVCVVALAAASASGKTAREGNPSRPPEKGCAWERLSDAKAGLEAWVQRCDFGFRKIDFLFSKGALSIRYSDGGDVDPLVDVFSLGPGETPEAGARRLFREKTDRALAARCLLVPYRDEFTKAPAGVDRYTFVPDRAYEAELKAKGEPEGVPDPPCGDWGESPDGIGYWEAQPARNPHKILFVQVGQDTPLFDERTLKLLPAK
jgi:ADP-ribose pyrophosphatase YjhB (NUDIX family)